jgi:hypothetical protein
MALLTGVALLCYAVNLFVLGPAQPGRGPPARDAAVPRGPDPAGTPAAGR